MSIKKKFLKLLQSRRVHARIKRKNKKNRALRFCSFTALVISLGCPVCILLSILVNSYSALTVTKILLPVEINADLALASNPSDLRYKSIGLLNDSLRKVFGGTDFKDGDEILSRNSYKELEKFFRKKVKDGGEYEIWFTASSIINSINKDKHLNDRYAKLLDWLKEKRRVKKFFNKSLFLKSDSREPENAGILGAFIGSLMTIIVCLALALPIGIMSGICLYEFMPKNRLMTNIVEISMNNLAAVPSIIFGVVGLTLYLGIFGLPRSSPLVGGMTLSFMMLPNIIIATKNAFANVPITIKDAAFALGAPHIKVILDHSLPIALPRIIHGTVLAIARILGESSPLLMMGMVAFIADTPTSFFDPATVLPVQIYIWSSNPEIAFVELAAIAIIALLLVLFALNLVANFVKRKFEFFNF
ncbi:phosphate ABC transporter permease PstA [Wolbachia endosymbiont of Drosophila bocki]|uniref:phosphate ABC transporter permease PstA n=1 Tax=unclassified Wolbachia TaxID=2640676 RepID=UPI0023A9382E|nr:MULTISPECIES: phosphate ABC transporter permease PstA [unclassified Wolbachia]MDE5058173.1 phosphate ABC transporter permease PstA [Wolbachia endosymbiont of Drosophila bocki]MDE5066875.1 phosphate ABC transporter permease PstA [Wolbachia endosymbiont of Drosophila leontia]